MKILSWNVNGIRASQKKGALDWAFAQDADIFCLQEIKAEKEQLDTTLQNPGRYKGYFWSSQERRGYSGTALYFKSTPDEVLYGLPSSKDLDKQGRVITGIAGNTAVVNVYIPNGKSNTAPLDFKLEFYQGFLKHLKELANHCETVVATGDFNVAHHEIDLARPRENVKSIGFLPEERDWLDTYQKEGFIDVFRAKYPDTVTYSYWDQKSRARERNVGWRIDYYFINQESFEKVSKINIHTETLGSDHAPHSIEIMS